VMGATPFLTRLYGPEEFGALALFAAAYAIAVGLITLKYDLSIILPSEHDKAVQLTALTLSISLILSLVFLFGLFISYFTISIPNHWYFFLLPFCLILGAAYTCSQQWCARENDYRRFSHSQIINSLVNVSVSLLLAISAFKLIGGLVIGFVAGLAVGLLYVAGTHLRLSLDDLRLKFGWSNLVTAAFEFKHFPMYVLPAALLATLGMNAPPFVFERMFSLQQVGYYAIASRFLMAPSAFVGGAVAEAFRAEFVDRQKRGVENTVFFINTLRKLIFLAFPIFSGFFVVAPSLFALLLGEPYRDSGVLSRYLCIGIFAQFIAQPFLYVFVATGYTRLGLLMQSALTILPLIGLILGGLSGKIEYAVLFSASLTFALSAILIGLAYRCCKHDDFATAIKVNNA
jgi:O-antigen/teichoic acid export membrane protein